MESIISLIKQASADPLIQFLFALGVGGAAFLVFYSVVSKIDKFEEFILGE